MTRATTAPAGKAVRRLVKTQADVELVRDFLDWLTDTKELRICTDAIEQHHVRHMSWHPYPPVLLTPRQVDDLALEWAGITPAQLIAEADRFLARLARPASADPAGDSHHHERRP